MRLLNHGFIVLLVSCAVQATATAQSSEQIAPAQTSGCLKGFAATGVEAEIKIVDLSPSPKALDLCDPSSLKYKLYSSVIFLQKLEQSRHKNGKADAASGGNPSPLSQQIMTGSIFSFFKARIQTVVFEDPMNSDICTVMHQPGLADFGRIGFYAEPNEMHLCDFAKTDSVQELIAVLVHESRHAEGFPHDGCKRGSLVVYQNQLACDYSYDTKGSYAVETEYQIDLSREPGLDPVLQLSARDEAITNFMNRFNLLPFDLRDGALLQEQSGKISFYDGEKLTHIWQGTPSDVLANRKNEPLVYRPSLGVARALDTTTGTLSASPDGNGSFTLDYENSLPASDKAALLDVYYSPSYSCFLFRTKMHCELQDSADLEFNTLVPVGLFLSASSNFVQPNTPYLVASDGSVFELPPTIAGLKLTKESDLKKVTLDQASQLVRFGSLQSQDLGLTRDGAAMIFVKEKKAWQNAPGLSDLKFKSLMTPYLWSAKLREL